MSSDGPGDAKTAAFDGPPDVRAAGIPIETLKTRPDFLKASRARRQVTPGFVLQARCRSPEERLIRVGYTCSKKLGNAVARNRAKRRLREVARLILPVHGKPGWDYVLVGRLGVTAQRPFAVMRADLEAALARIDD